MKAKLYVNKNFTIGEIDKRIYGSFIEHIGRAVYTGIYEPGHETADGDGFRRDVIDFIREIDVPIVRYPGGNFVSDYNWEDGVGDKTKRPRRPDCAWFSIETNQFGTDEFAKWVTLAGTEAMMAVNLGTRGPEEAKNLLEYCNLDTDTYYANMRRENGFDKPFGIKTWCLGNEMDGPWQIGMKTPIEYARVAAETAKLMKYADPDIELVACGSSGYDMPLFGEWEETVLEHTYDYVEYLSLHQYYNNRADNTAEFIGNAVHMDRYIKDAVAICDAVKAKKHSDKTINISFDEWNIWYHFVNDTSNRWQEAPHINEDIYNFEDALLVGTMLMTLQNNCDRVKMACLAQLVNVIAPIMTEKDGKAWLQTIFYPYMYASRYGRGVAMKAVSDCDGYKTSYSDNVPYLASSVIYNEAKGEIVVFAVNRSLDEDMELTLELDRFGKCQMTKHIELYSDDFKAKNSPDCQRVAPKELDVKADRGEVHKIMLKKHSWNMMIFTL